MIHPRKLVGCQTGSQVRWAGLQIDSALFTWQKFRRFDFFEKILYHEV